MTITVLNILANGTQTLESREVPDDYFAVPQDGGQSATDETAKGPQADADTAALGTETSVSQDGGQSATDEAAKGPQADADTAALGAETSVPQDGGQSAADETTTAGGEAASGTKPDSETSTQ